MTCRVRIDKAGRVILPKPVRDELQLQPGDSLEIESAEDRVVLRPVRGAHAPAQKERSLGLSYRSTVAGLAGE